MFWVIVLFLGMVNATRVSYSSSTSTSAVDETTKPSSVEREEAYGKGLVSGIFSGIGNVIEKAVWFLRHFNQKRRDVTDKILDHLFVTKLEQEPDARR